MEVVMMKEQKGLSAKKGPYYVQELTLELYCYQFLMLMLLKVLLFSFFFPLSFAVDTLSANESLADNNTLLSKEGTFALGFFSPGSSTHKYLGIWYHKLPGQTVVWVANRNNPINDSSGVLSMNRDGNLALHGRDGQRFPLWSTNVSVKGTDGFVAQLLDSGNFVLVQNISKRIIWQSFDYPTDTMLAGMKIGFSRIIGLSWFLTSWKSADDPGTGDWFYKLNPTGCPQIFLYRGTTPYWRGNPWPWRSAQRGFVATSVYNQDETYFSYSSDDESIISRVVVNSTGLYQRLIWDNSSTQWIVSRSEPKYTYGHCGAYSILDPNNNDGLDCTCLPGYEPKSIQNWYARDSSDGCVQKRQQTMSVCRNGEGFVKVESVKLPDASIAAVMNTSMNIVECEKLCMSNCSCKAYANVDREAKGLGCLVWFGELMDTMPFPNERDLYVRVDSIELAQYEKKKKGFFKKKGTLAIPIVSASFMIFLTVLFAYFCLWKKRKNKGTANKNGPSPASVATELEESRHHPDLPIFSLSAISAATNEFSLANKLGQGGFGSVYRGQLQNGQEIAVKRLSRSSGQGIAEFKNEVMLIVKLQHRNLVKLLGCCIEQDEQMLVYEYLPNKSLDLFIFNQKRRSVLDWNKCFDIIIGIARGILYLHQDSRLRIIHRDLKTSNVLLDADMNPKISDFGMARIFGGDQVQDETKRVVGTYGYMAPEYAAFGKFSTKSDVFSFGVILLEILSGKKSNYFFQEDPSLSLLGHVWELWKKGRAFDILDSSLRHPLLPPEVFRSIHVGLLCVQEDAADRPTMSTVVLMLNGETVLPNPNQPAFILRRTSNDPTGSTSGGGTSLNEVTITKVEAR